MSKGSAVGDGLAANGELGKGFKQTTKREETKLTNMSLLFMSIYRSHYSICMIPSQWLVHCCALVLYSARSFTVQGPLSGVYRRWFSMVWGSVPQSHVVRPLRYSHLLRASLERPMPDWRLRGCAWLSCVGGCSASIPARMYRLLMLVGCRHRVMYLQLGLMGRSSFLVWGDLSHTGQTYSPGEKQKARAVGT